MALVTPDRRPKNAHTKFGERLLPQVVDGYARECPNRVFGSYPISNDVSSGYFEVTMGQLASAVNFLAWWIKEKLGTSMEFETLAFVGIPDFRYPIFCLAAIKCGFKALLPGTRNSVAQIQSLLKRAACMKMIHSSEMAATIEQLDLETNLEAPSLEIILTSESPLFPYDKQFSAVQNDPILVIHSSGTTGDPKIITMTHGTVSVTDNDRYIPCPGGRKAQNGAQFDFEAGGGFYSCFPPYHLAGLQAYLILPIFSNSASIIIGPPQVPPSGQLMVDIIKAKKGVVRAFYVPPSMIDQWAQSSESIEQAHQLDFILYGGGPLPPEVGNKLCQLTDVCQMYGSAETGQVQLLVPQNGEWSYMEWNPAEEVDMQPSIEGTCEMVLHQKPRFLRHRSLSHNFPAIKEWRSGDLFLPHPTKSGLWRYHGRMDDLIVLANSHKINPVSFETQLLSDKIISGVLIIGTNRIQPALLLELVQGTGKEDDQVINEIWPLIQKLNVTMPQYARISRSKILVGRPDRPFVRSPKGSVVRQLTIDLYYKEIQEIYFNPTTVESAPVNCSSQEGILNWIRESLKLILPEKVMIDDEDFFSSGMDSLKVVEYTNMLRFGLRDQSLDLNNISSKMIYQNPTTSQLARAIQSLTTISSVKDSQSLIANLIERYSRFSPPPISKRHVILTGATGSLGLQVLTILQSDPNFEKIYCLVRSRTRDLERTQSFSGTDKVEMIEIDISSDRLGLDDGTYKLLTSRVDSIIHLAWAVNFNLSLQSFENTHIRGLRSIIDLSINNPLRPQIVFSSSTAYATDWAISQAKEKIPETLLPNLDFVSSGYGKSKQVAEYILARASTECEIPVTILRIGQISCSVRSDNSMEPNWSKNEWVPSMIAASKAMNLIPTSNIPIDWVPRDMVARFLTKSIAVPTKHPSKFQIHNVVNPKITPWMSFVQALHEEIPTAKLVPLREWVKLMLSYDSSDVVELSRLPALKLKNFFQGLVEVDEFHETKTLQFDVAEWEDSSARLGDIGGSGYEMVVE